MPKIKDDDQVAAGHDVVGKLEYIEQMLRELRGLARNLDADTLTYLLEMSAMEAADTLKAKRVEITMGSRRT